jgi:ubiquinone/menaquinone biosynthesis C-methylase UbiE
MAAEQSTSPGERLLHIVLGYRVSQAIRVAVQLGIPDLLAEGPLNADNLAAATGSHAPSLYRVLRLVASEGIFAEDGDRRFSLTPMGEMLRRDAPGSLRPMSLVTTIDALWQAWGDLLHSVRTGETAFEHVNGIEIFEYFRHHHDESAVFDELMSFHTAPVTQAVASKFDFSRFSTVVDVGGGRGTLALGLLEALPHIRAIVFDQPAAANVAAQAIKDAGMADRCEAVGGDFFEAVPGGGDVYLLKFVLHDWDDERCITILQSCRRVMPAEGRLLVIELLVPAGNDVSFAKSQDVNMLVNFGGRERNEAEYAGLFAASGFAPGRTIHVAGELYMIEGISV